MTARKRILCYGDSNTWAHNVETDGRFGPDVRWTGVLQSVLGREYIVIEEGLGGRTTVRDDPYEPHRNGRTYLIPCLLSHAPLDLIIMMLGTNDLKNRFGVSAKDIGRGISLLCDDIQATSGEAVDILIVAPAPLSEQIDPEDMFGGGIATSKKLGAAYQLVAETKGVDFFDAATVVTLVGGDGIHLSAENHGALGHALGQRVLAVIG